MWTRKFVAKKTFILALLFLAVWQLASSWKIAKKLDFSIEKSFSVGQFLSEKADLDEVIDWALSERRQLVEKMWGEKAMVGLIPKTGYMVFGRADNIMVVLLFSEEKVEGEKAKRLSGESFNISGEEGQRLENKLKKKGLNIKTFLDGMKEKKTLFTNFNKTNFEEMRSIYPGMAFGFAETKILLLAAEFCFRLTGYAYLGSVANSLEDSEGSEASRQIEKVIAEMEKDPFYAFAPYFLANKAPIFWKETLKKWGLTLKSITYILTLILFLFFLVLNLIISDIDTLLDKEFARRGITISLRERFAILLANWKAFVFLWEVKAAKQIAKQVAQRVSNTYRMGLLAEERNYRRQIKERIRSKKRKLQLRQETECIYFGSGKEKDTLFARIGRRSRRERIIAQTRISEIEIDYDKFSVREIENIFRAYNFLKSESQALLEAFLVQDIRNLVQANCSFMKAINDGDIKFLHQKLEVATDQEQKDPLAINEIVSGPVFTEDLRVFILGAGTVVTNKDSLVQAIKELGSERVEFWDVGKQNRVRSMIRSVKLNPEECLLIILADSFDHTVRYKLSGLKNVRQLLISRIVNADRFQKEVANSYKINFGKDDI
jgi:hypothetical protein